MWTVHGGWSVAPWTYVFSLYYAYADVSVVSFILFSGQCCVFLSLLFSAQLVVCVCVLGCVVLSFPLRFCVSLSLFPPLLCFSCFLSSNRMASHRLVWACARVSACVTACVCACALRFRRWVMFIVGGRQRPRPTRVSAILRPIRPPSRAPLPTVTDLCGVCPATLGAKPTVPSHAPPSFRSRRHRRLAGVTARVAAPAPPTHAPAAGRRRPPHPPRRRPPPPR